MKCEKCQKLVSACKKALKWLEECEPQVIEHDSGFPYEHIGISKATLERAITEVEGGK